MKKSLLVLLGVIVILLAGYFYVASKSSSADYKNAVITLERTDCYGFCPVYTLKIEGNGTVTYNGKRYVKTTGTQTAQISEAKVKELVDAFYDADYFSLNLGDSDKLKVPDIASKITSITIGGKTTTVTNQELRAPEKLTALENKIDEIANSKIWVGSGKCNMKNMEVVCE